jgi:hypothetical protein
MFGPKRCNRCHGNHYSDSECRSIRKKETPMTNADELKATAERIVAEWRAHWVHGSTDPLVAAIAAAIKAEREACCAAVKNATYMVDIDDLGHGPFTIQDKVTLACIEQAIAAIRGRL